MEQSITEYDSWNDVDLSECERFTVKGEPHTFEVDENGDFAIVKDEQK